MYYCYCPYINTLYLTGWVRETYKIVINVDARILTLYRDGNVYKSYPIAVGKPATPSPRGTFKVKNKAYKPGGVYGERWLGLSVPGGGYGIHGTDNPSSIGKAISNGCVRMYNKDVIEVYNLAPVGTVVEIR